MLKLEKSLHMLRSSKEEGKRLCSCSSSYINRTHQEALQAREQIPSLLLVKVSGVCSGEWRWSKPRMG